LPKVGREKMDDFSEDAKTLKDLIEYEPKSTEDYVANMDVVERLNERFDLLESKLLAIENVYAIMREIPLPISGDDSSALKNLRTLINSLGQKVDWQLYLVQESSA
jgi:hypothetical protein